MPFKRQFRDKYAGRLPERFCCPNFGRLVLFFLTHSFFLSFLFPSLITPFSNHPLSLIPPFSHPPSDTHPCVMPENGGCSHFCFSAFPSDNFMGHRPLTRICGCPYGQKIGADQQKCIEDTDTTALPDCNPDGQ